MSQKYQGYRIEKFLYKTKLNAKTKQKISENGKIKPCEQVRFTVSNNLNQNVMLYIK